MYGFTWVLWLAWGALRDGGPLEARPDRMAEPGWRTALRGALINILNPKLSLFFLALLPPFLTGEAATASREMMQLGAVFMAMTFAVFALYGAFAAAARRHVLDRPAVLRWISRGIAGIFAALAARLAVERA